MGFRDMHERNHIHFGDRRLRSAAAFAFVALFTVTLACRIYAADTATILTREGRVEFAVKGTAQWTPAQTNQSLKLGDQVRTGLRSRATIRMTDLSVLRLNELTTIEIDAPEQTGGKAELNQKSGASYFLNREQPTAIRFRTPIASGAIRGTEFNLVVDADGRTVVTMIDGEVVLSNPQGDVTVTSGYQATAAPGQAPTRTAVIDATNIIQWALYYPAVVDPDEIGLADAEKNALTDSLNAYRAGDLLGALNSYPDNRQPGSDPERIYRAAILLAAGQVEQSVTMLNALQAASPLADALREVIAAVKGQSFDPQPPATASQAMADSYYFQSRGLLELARRSAREALGKSPKFGAAWIRLAELEFGFGQTGEALDALNRGLAISPRNAQGVALKGFILSAQNRWDAAYHAFDDAIGLDGALGNAWLGRGLLKIRRGDNAAGRADLQVAATLEPQRSILRSYLGKAFSATRDTARAEKELALARKLDPNDPTPWLYTALLEQQENRINDAATSLRKSQELNENRSLFRSRLLLDQDQSVRSANLAAVYRAAGMTEVSTREAARAASYDYGNYSAHLFLANSYDALRDPRSHNLRYETPWFSELLIANLLAPVGAGNLSQYVSQQEYSRLFDANHFGVYNDTEYFSSGEWRESGSQYGVYNNFSYSLDADYHTDPGQRPNNDIETLNLAARFKYQMTPKDSVFLQVSRFDLESGDVAQYYSQANFGPNFHAKERQEPNVIGGYHREWFPGMHTLLLLARFDDTFWSTDNHIQRLYYDDFASPVQLRATTAIRNRDYSLDFQSRLEDVWSTELQQIWQIHKNTLVAGIRYQTAGIDTKVDLKSIDLINNAVYPFPQTQENDLNRASIYAYDSFQPWDWLLLSAGVTYDRLEYPLNVDVAPISNEENTEYRVSPKAGFVITPFRDTHLRGAYTRSLGGVFFDQSVRLEPTQIATFNQSYRSLIPESVQGLVPGTRFETFHLGVDHTLKTGTYLGAQAELLKSDGDRLVGAFANEPGTGFPNVPINLRQSLWFQEKTLLLTVDQLIARDFSVGARYRLSRADLDTHFDIPPGVGGSGTRNGNVAAVLHQLYLYAIANHPSGAFMQWDSLWSQQSNRNYFNDIPGDDFWQHNIFFGWRFLQRQLEVRVGVLNLTDQNYQLNPLNLYSELPRERTFTASLKFFF